MMATIEGKDLYVVDLDALPTEDVTGIGWEAPYAVALNSAIALGNITGPGKYGIWIDEDPTKWQVYEIIQ